MCLLRQQGLFSAGHGWIRWAAIHVALSTFIRACILITSSREAVGQHPDLILAPFRERLELFVSQRRSLIEPRCASSGHVSSQDCGDGEEQ